jgi:hypothetical protein
VRAASGWRSAAASALVPVGLVLVAALLRLPNLAARGQWDADQGHDMLVLRALVRDGVVPLLGPPTSIGQVHHGALYYYLLAPAVAVTGGDSPLAVVVEIALAGIVAVIVTWWLARAIGGPVAGLVAGLAMAVSISGVEESTFIWNPNLIALSSAVALAGAWRAWSTRQPRWWLVAAVGTAVTMQCHVLGVTLLPIVGALFVADARRRDPGAERRAVWRLGVAGLAVIVLSFVPLVVHELTNDFSEAHAALDYLSGGGDATTTGPLVRFLVIGARVLSWPLSGLLTDAGWVALAATGAVIAIAVWRAVAAAGEERIAVRWLGVGLLWTAFLLTFLSPSLATVVPGLPNDHYHAFADPIVFVLVGLAAGALWRLAGGAVGGVAQPRVAVADAGGAPSLSHSALARSLAPGRLLVVVGVGLVLAWNLAHQPPAVSPDGGFPAAEVAAARIATAAKGDEITLRSIPSFKTAEAYAYPLTRAGVSVVEDTSSGPVAAGPGTLVVVCDTLFETVTGASCGGPAEAVVAPPDRFGPPVDQFTAAPGRTISIYRVAP